MVEEKPWFLKVKDELMSDGMGWDSVVYEDVDLHKKKKKVQLIMAAMIILIILIIFKNDHQYTITILVLHPTDRLAGLVHPSSKWTTCPHKNPMKITRVN